MTFDDGILTVYEKVNKAEAGNKPKYELKKRESFYFGFDSLGYNRFYTALQASHQIEAVVNIPLWSELEGVDVVILEDGKQYIIGMVQRLLDDDGLRYTKLSLERFGEKYVVSA